MPWSISPRLANGSRTYSLLFSHVFAGDGNSLAHVALDTAQRATTIPIPISGRTNQSSFSFRLFISHVSDPKSQTRENHQIPITQAPGLAIWCLGFLWGLVIGFWGFH